MKNRLSALLFCCFFVICTIGIRAQHFQHESDTFINELGDTGTVKYSYRINGIEEKLKDGEFYFVKTVKKDSGYVALISKDIWQGDYKNDRKNGPWQFKESHYAVNLEDVVQGTVKYDLRSTSRTVSGYYKKDVPSDEWQYSYVDQGYKNSDLRLDELTMPFSKGLVNGEVHGNFFHQGQRVRIKGSALNGFMDGEWLISTDSITESRQYVNGFLISICTKSSAGDTLSYVNFPLSKIIEDQITLGKYTTALVKPTRIAFNDGYPKESVYRTSQQWGNKALQDLFKRLLKYQSAWIEKEGSPIGTNRAIYPLSAEEQASLKSWYALNDRYNDLLQEIKQEELVDLSESDVDSIRLVARWLTEQEEKQQAVEGWVDEFFSQKLENTNREGLVVEKVKDLLSKDSLERRDGIFVITYDTALEETNLLFFLEKNYVKRIELAEQFLITLKNNITSLKLANKTRLLQDGILALRAELDSTLKESFKDASLNRLVRKVHDNYLDEVVSTDYDAFLQAKNNKKQQAIIGDSVLRELRSIEQVYVMCQKIAARRLHVDTLYTEYVFDPFTYTDNVPSRVKRRLYFLVAIQLFNDMVDRATSKPTPAECLEELKQLYAIQGELVFLRNTNTKSLEKRLRKEKSIDGRIKILKEYESP